ncbi:hypothetical protein CF327_g6776 [Tilletia walkeri]|nr:hypothetical protein CF327_g6776 [Tilletia walkeri]
MILTRIATSSFGIEELNLRVSPQQDLLDIVSDIVNRNKRLRIVRIDVNSTVVSNRNISPTIRLDRMFGCYKARVPLERFILRAPGCNIKTFATSKQQQANFFKHLRCVQEFVMACHVFNALLPTMIWTYHLLRHMPKLEFGDVAVYAPDSHTTSMSDVDLPLLHMHSLEKLSIQIPEVDTHFLRSINALCLFKLRIKSSVPVELWPACVDNHFPNLFIANVMCPGPSAPRIRALGVPERSFYQNLGNMHNHVRPHNQPFLAYIKPYGRRRQEQPPALTMNTQPYPLPEASDMGWDEEDSEASVTTGSDYSDSEEEDAADSPTPDVSQYSDDSTLTELTDTEQGTSSEPEMDWDEDVDDNEGDDDEEDPDYIPTSPTSELLNTSQIEPAMSAPEEVGTEPALASGSSSTLTSLAAEAAPTSPPSKRARLSLT